MVENSSAKDSYPGDDAVAVRAQLVVEDHRRDRGKQPQTGGQKSLGNARRHDGQIGVLLFGDVDEGMHDPPDRAEKADEGRCRPDRRQNLQPALQRFGFAGDGHIHAAVDPRGRPGDQRAIGAVAALPFQHPGGEDALGPAVGFGADLFEQPVERFPRPEALIELVGLATGLSEGDVLLNDDRPGPERGQDQDQHGQFHDERGLREQRPHGEIHLLCGCQGFCFHLACSFDA